MDLAAALGAVPGLNVVGGGDKRAKFLAAVVKDLKAAGAEGAGGGGSAAAGERARDRGADQSDAGQRGGYLHEAGDGGCNSASMR